VTWTIQYFNGTVWVTKADAGLDQIIDELNGQLQLDFILPNTPANFTFIQSDQQVQILWGSTSVFSGLLRAYRAEFTKLTCTVYNNTFEQMKKRQITGKYNTQAANTVLSAICSAAGLTAGSCPTTQVSVQFNATDCYTAALNLANILGLNLYNIGTTVNIAVKGNQTPTALTIDASSNVSIDRSKAGYDGVVIRGVDQAGSPITGSAGNTGAGYNVKTLTNKVAMSQASLNSLASSYLQSLQQTNSGSPLECDISQAALLGSGDLITVSNGGAFGLSGSYEVYRITKTLSKATVEIVHPVNIFDNLINAMADSTTALNTLPISTDQVQTPSALVLQGLLDLYHLTEGQGTVANDATPNGSPNNGIITSGSWVQGPLAKVLQFAGSGYVDCGSIIDVTQGATTNKFAIGGWFSPEAYGADQNYIITKDGQFLLQQVGTSGQVRFGVHIGGNWIYLTSPNSIAPLNGRCFAMGVYDGVNMYLYVADPSGISQLLTYSQAQTGSLDASTNDVFLGSKSSSSGGFNGVVAECMIWSRALGAQEVQELYFSPLVQVVNSQTNGGNVVSMVRIRPNIQTKTAYAPTTEYIKSECIQADGTIVAAPTGKVVTYEAGYIALALMFKNETGAMALVQKILDAYVLLQNLDGSWYQQYNAVMNATGTHDRAAYVDSNNQNSGDLKVDSGCALLIHAMSDWDRLNSQTRYKAVVQLGLSFLHTLSYDHTVAYGNSMIANLIYQGTVDTMAFSADTAECLLAMQAALNAYGSTLTGSEGYSTKTLANSVFYGLVAYAYRGDAFRAYMTTNPINTQCLIPFDYKENISYAQAITAMAVKLWSVDANNTAGDFSSQAEKVLDQAGALTNGQWGGCLYVPYYGNSDENQDEYTVYSAFMCLAMQNVDSTKYAGRITQLKDFIKLVTTQQGQAYDVCEKTGDLYICKLNAPNQPLIEGYGFITLTAATALYSGAA
jgi:hypothetical protein